MAEVMMEATTPWMPAHHPPCPVCARRRAIASQHPSVQRVADGAEIETDVLTGASLLTEDIEADALPSSEADIVAVRIPPLAHDDVMLLRIPRACIETRALSISSDPLPPANTVVLPERWYLLEASVPTVVSRIAGGCTRIAFDAPPDDTADVTFTIVRHSIAAAM
jgi:hypothetical protein